MAHKLSYSLRIDNANGFHTTATIFTALIPNEQDHAQASRGKAGQFTMRAEEFDAFILRTRPQVISFPPELSDYGIQELGKKIGEEVHELYALQAKQGTWDYPKWVLKEANDV